MVLGIEYVVLASVLLVGLFLYERYGWRLGGVMVLPLVAAYGLLEPWILPVFVATTILAYLAGEAVRRRTLIYGRRMLYVHILAGLLAAGVLLEVLGADGVGVVLAVLPGITAFNLHRQPSATRSMGRILALLLPLYLGAHVLLLPFGFEGGLFARVPRFHDISIHVIGFLGAILPVELPGVPPLPPGILDGGSLGAILGTLGGGGGE